MRKRKVSASEALALLNAAPKQQMNYGGRETLSTFQREYQAKEQARKQADLEASLEPIKREQAKLLAELQKKEVRELRIALMMKPSEDFEAPLYAGADSPEVIQNNIAAALYEFRQGEGSLLSDADLLCLREFLQLNTQYKQFDLTSPSVWGKAWQFIQSKLNPTPQQDETAIDPTIETPEWTPEETASRDEQDRKVRDAEWADEFKPIFREAVNSLERSSGFVMHHPQMLELAAHFDKRSANSKRPIPMTVFELRKTAYQLWGNDIGPIQDDRSFLIDEDSQLTSEDLKRKYGFTHSYSNQMLTATENARG
jgi:hypothetical protein